MENDIQNIEIWKQCFGLFPVRLRPDLTSDNSYILLNGGNGDFCLKKNASNPEEQLYRSLAWSSNTKNFVIINKDSVFINNWSTNKLEQIPEKTVSSNLDKFYDYLVTNSFKSDNVVPYVIDLFRRLRNSTKEKNEPVVSLNLLFILLSSLEDELTNFSFEKWGLPETEIPSVLDDFSRMLKKGVLNIAPNLETILRHTSGSLFQEAQKEILLFDSQLDLWKNFSNKLIMRKIPYSSIHYTPAFLSRTIVEHTLKAINLNQPAIKIFDPACGSGEFLTEALKQLTDLNFPGKIIIEGWDSSQTAVNTTTYLLSFEKRTLWKENLTFNIKLVNDSLSESWGNDYDLILMNPPFVSWEHLNSTNRESLAETIGSRISGKPNQASGFLTKAIENIRPGGAVGSVIPTTVLTLGSYQKLRSHFKDLGTVRLVAKLGNFIFEDALTDASLIVLSKSIENHPPLLIWTRNEKNIAQNALRDLRKMVSMNSFKVEKVEYSIYTPDSFPVTKESWRPISLSEINLVKDIKRFELNNKLIPLIKVFDVKQGIRTGKNDAFIIAENLYNELPNNERSFFRPVVNNDSIASGKICIVNYVWYPYDANGILIQTENDLRALAPNFYERHFFRYRAELVSLARKHENNWWHLSEHRAWLRIKSPRIFSGEFGSSKSFGFDKDGSYAIERGNAWLPKKEFLLFDHHYFYLAIFSSTFFDKLLSIYSKELAGGKWYDLGKQYTKDIPIPNIYDPQISESKITQKLIELGKELIEEGRNVRPAIDEIVSKYFYPS
jgi:adenine-specific DNA-methyltransferase